MLKLLKQIVGAILLACGSLLFLVFTVDLSADIRIAGPMNMWPPPAWVYLILDSLFVLLAFVGIKMMRLKRIVCGSVMSVVSVFALIFIVKNHVDAPPREGFNDGRYIPADVEGYVLAYMIAASVLGVGLWFIIRHARSRKPPSMPARMLKLFLTSLAISYCGIAHAQTKPNARTIVGLMVAQYKTASSYQDSGTVRIVQGDPKIANRLENISFQSPSLNNDTLVSFKTYYTRPKMFRFDWKSAMMTGSREASIWSDGRKVYEWMPTVGARDDGFTLSTSKYLTLTVDEAVRSSSGAVFPLISMLIDNASIVSFAHLLNRATGLALLKEEPVEGKMCFVVKAILSGAPWTLWIDKQSNLLRKTRTIYFYGSFHERVEKGISHEFVAEEIHRDIKINEPMPRGIFKYRPKLQPYDSDYTH